MPKTLNRLKTEIEANYPVSGTNFHIMLLNDLRSSYTFGSGNVSGSTLTITGNDFENGTRIVLGGTVPAPLATGTIGSMSDTGIVAITGTAYYVVNKSGSNFQLSATKGGSNITLTNTGSGTMTISDVPLDATDDTVSEWVRKEVASYQSPATRQAYTPTTATTDTAISGAKLTEQSVSFDNTSGGGSIVFDKAAMVRGGSATPENTTGTIDSFFDFGASQTIAAGENRAIKIPNQLVNT